MKLILGVPPGFHSVSASFHAAPSAAFIFTFINKYPTTIWTLFDTIKFFF
jgi:hypothetical protein